MNQRKSLLVKTIVPSKKSADWVTVITTSNEVFPVRKSFVDKAANTEAVEVEKVPAGSNLYGYDSQGNPIPAPRDSKRTHQEGENKGQPLYLTGEFPKTTEDQWVVKGFFSATTLLNSLRLAALEKQLANMQ